MLLSRLNSSFRGFAAFTSLAFSLLVCPKKASACECGFAERVIPSANDKNVPTNTKIWTNGIGCEQASLRKNDGTEVPTTVAQLGRITIIQPTAELELGATYEVGNCASLLEPTAFTVTEGTDTTPPEVPTFTLGEPKSSGSTFSSCGEELYVPVDVKYEGALLILDVAGRSTFDPKTFTGKPVDEFFPGDKVIVGDEICWKNNWDFEADGDAINTRFGAFDLAGNFSGMSAPAEVEAGCTCTAAGATSANGGGYALAGLALLGLSRIRRKR
jgi:MYXO-CTERM domain-containing protein